MSKLSVDQFIKASELYLRLTEKGRPVFYRDQIDRFNCSDKGAISKSSQISYRRYVDQINNTRAK